jgi:putative hydrolase of the HAD superfamily
MTLSCVIFDMDDVLCGYHVDKRIEYLASVSGRTVDFVRQAIWETDFLDRSDRGEFSAADYLAEFGRRLRYPLTRAQWIAARKGAMPVFRDMLDLVAALKTRMQVALLTNNDHLVAETLGQLFPEVVPLFDNHLYVSAKLGLAKPDPACFLTVCKAIGLAPEDCFFTDDRAENIDGAEAAGLSGHVFLGKAGLVQALIAKGIVV